MYTYDNIDSPFFPNEDFEELQRRNKETFSAAGVEFSIVKNMFDYDFGITIMPERGVYKEYDSVQDAIDKKGAYFIAFNDKMPLFRAGKFMRNWDLSQYNNVNCTLLKANCTIRLVGMFLNRPGYKGITVDVAMPENLKETLIALNCPYWKEIEALKKSLGYHPTLMSFHAIDGEIQWDKIGFRLQLESNKDLLKLVENYISENNREFIKVVDDTFQLGHLKFVFTNGVVTDIKMYYPLQLKSL